MSFHYDSSRRYYECHDCGERQVTKRHLSECPSCGGRLRNLAVPREQ